MSPVVLRVGKYTIRIYTDDHPPAHVHVQSAGNRAKIRIRPTVVVRNYGFNERDLTRLLKVIEENEDYLLSEWQKLFTEE